MVRRPASPRPRNRAELVGPAAPTAFGDLEADLQSTNRNRPGTPHSKQDRSENDPHCPLRRIARDSHAPARSLSRSQSRPDRPRRAQPRRMALRPANLFRSRPGDFAKSPSRCAEGALSPLSRHKTRDHLRDDPSYPVCPFVGARGFELVAFGFSACGSSWASRLVGRVAVEELATRLSGGWWFSGCYSAERSTRVGGRGPRSSSASGSVCAAATRRSASAWRLSCVRRS